MPDTYTSANFSNDVIPSGFNAEAHKTMRGAVAVGWKLVVTNRGHCTLVAPPPNDHITINVSQKKSDGPVKGIRAKIAKYGNPRLLAEAERENQQKSENSSLDQAALERAQRQREKFLAEQESEAGSVPTELEQPTPEEPEREVVSRRHHGSTGSSIERKWSDGSVDYECSFEGCDFASENPRSINPHRRAHFTYARVPDQKVKETVEQQVERTSRKVTERLAARRRKAEKAAGFTPVDEPLEIPEAAPEPVSDAAAVLDQIRSLLDDGTFARQAAEIAALRAERESLEARATEAENEAQRLKGELSSLASLLKGYSDE